MKSKFFITHYFNDTPPDEGLRKLSFLSATTDSIKEKKFYLGYDAFQSINEEEIGSQIAEGSLKRFSDDLEVNVDTSASHNKIPWIDKNSGIWIADSEAPFYDKARRLVFTPSKDYSVPEELGGKRTMLIKRIYGETFSGVVKAKAVRYLKVPQPDPVEANV